MSDPCAKAIESAVRLAAQSGEILIVAHAAKSIASACGGSPSEIAEALTQAGIKAGLTMQFGTLE